MTFLHSNDHAMGESNFDRRKLDFYPTPEWVTEAVVPFLLRHVDTITSVWECAAGDGCMSRVLERHFEEVISTDVTDYGYPYCRSGVDFLAFPGSLRDRTLIITNPPYGDLAEAFIRQALKITKKASGVVAMLVRHEYVCSKSRVDLFNKPPYARNVVLTTRPRWIPDSTGAPRHNYDWCIWDWSWQQEPVQNFHIRGGKST